MNKIDYLPVVWPDNGLKTPVNVHAYTSLRSGGVSANGYAKNNLALHVGDDARSVLANRAKLRLDLSLPAEPVWLAQVHSNKVYNIDAETTALPASPAETPAASLAASPETIQADASVSSTKGVVCSVMTADCLPVFFCNQAGTEVAVAHAGWRGLHAGIISNTVAAMQSPVDEILVALGPAIGPQAFEVGDEVFQAFVNKQSANSAAFKAAKKDHYLCDIYQLARNELTSLGITQVTGGEYCTYSDATRFYSYRRQQNTGRMASLIWLE